MPDDATQPVATSLAAQESTALLDAARARAVDDWQNKILPFVKWGIGILALIVFVAVIAAGSRVLHSVETGSKQSEIFADSLNKAVTEQFPIVAKINAGLASYQTAREQDRAGAELLTRELLRFSSFLIGAALCFVGSIFVMGKFSDLTPNTARAEHDSLKASISTASPGLFALTVGAILVGIGVFAHYPVTAQLPNRTSSQQAVISANSGATDDATLAGWDAAGDALFGKQEQ